VTRRSRNLAGAAAAVLLVVVVVGLYLATNRAYPPASDPVTPAFGKLPAPVLNPPLGIGGVADSTALAIPYFGSAKLSWSGLPPKAIGTAPVERLTLPTPVELDAFARGVGGILTSAWATARIYQLPGDYNMVINYDNPVGVEPNFVINRLKAVTPAVAPVSTDAARTAADAFLRAHGLTPAWDNAVIVTRSSSLSVTVFSVLYQREILVGSSRVPEVDRSGSPQGILVEVESGGQVVSADGVVRLAAQSATYGLRPPASAVPDALVAPPAMAPDQFPSLSPFPTVALTREQLVYIAVAAGSGTTYLEPAFLFTGTFTQGGTDFEKRVLVPALVTSAIKS
jgi:hypothetical protein